MTTLEVRSPFDNALVGETTLRSEAEVEQALHIAHECFKDKKNWLKPYQRIEILEEFKSYLADNIEALAHQAAQEGGKPLTDSLIEAQRAVVGVQIAIEHISQLNGQEIPMGLTESSANRMAFTFKEPVGVVLAISAFNHPLNLAIHQIIPAIATGCPVLFKPASSTPLSGQSVIDMLHECGLPKDYAHFIPTTASTIEPFVSDSRISFMSFIGSHAVGWHLRSLLAKGASCALEHGGAAPVIVEEDADLEAIVPLLVKGSFYHAGQVCVSVQRIYAHHKIAAKLGKLMAKAAKKLKVGHPTQTDTDVGPLISPKETQRIHTWVDEAVKEGAKLLCGGHPLSESTFEPTILFEPKLNSKVSQQEIFGPVVCINSYKSLDDAIRMANAPNFSFQAALFSNNLENAIYATRHLEATTVLVNDQTAFRADWMPFGGRKLSGLGMGGIPDSMNDLCHDKMMIFKSNHL